MPIRIVPPPVKPPTVEVVGMAGVVTDSDITITCVCLDPTKPLGYCSPAGAVTTTTEGAIPDVYSANFQDYTSWCGEGASSCIFGVGLVFNVSRKPRYAYLLLDVAWQSGGYGRRLGVAFNRTLLFDTGSTVNTNTRIRVNAEVTNLVEVGENRVVAGFILTLTPPAVQAGAMNNGYLKALTIAVVLVY